MHAVAGRDGLAGRRAGQGQGEGDDDDESNDSARNARGSGPRGRGRVRIRGGLANRGRRRFAVMNTKNAKQVSEDQVGEEEGEEEEAEGKKDGAHGSSVKRKDDKADQRQISPPSTSESASIGHRLRSRVKGAVSSEPQAIHHHRKRQVPRRRLPRTTSYFNTQVFFIMCAEYMCYHVSGWLSDAKILCSSISPKP